MKAVMQEVVKKTRLPQRVYTGTWSIPVEGKSEEITQLFCGSDFAKVSFKIRTWEKKALAENAAFVSLVLRDDLVI